MHSDKLSMVTKIALSLAGIVAALVLWVIIADPLSGGKSEPQTLAQGPIPAPEDTQEPTSPLVPATSTDLPPTPTVVPSPTVLALQSAVLVTHTLSTALVISDVVGVAQPIVDSPEGIDSMAWAPTGDKMLYVTKSGGLYWVNSDGTDATLLHQYEPDTWRLLRDQQPMSNTLLLTHNGPAEGMSRGPGHMDVVHFSPGNPPTLEEVPEAGTVFQMRWWSPDRASGIVVRTDVGGEKFVTLDANGHVVEERNIPYIWSGAVRPGGEWLAYATSQQTTDTPLYGSDPETVYLLNLTTGERKQITASGRGTDVFSWSPDGNWFLIGTYLDGALRGVLVSADGHEWITVTPPGTSGYDAVWSPDSKQLAFSTQYGGREDPNSLMIPYNSKVYIVDVPSRTIHVSEFKGPGDSATPLLTQPNWSPDGKQLALISWDPNCSPRCSGTTPALYLVSTAGFRKLAP